MIREFIAVLRDHRALNIVMLALCAAPAVVFATNLLITSVAP